MYLLRGDGVYPDDGLDRMDRWMGVGGGRMDVKGILENFKLVGKIGGDFLYMIVLRDRIEKWSSGFENCGGRGKMFFR